MPLRPPWVQSGPDHPCPICQRDKRGNRCFFIPDQVAYCYYAISQTPKQTAAGEAWLHRLGDHRAVRPLYRATPKPAAIDPHKREDLGDLAPKFRDGCAFRQLCELSRELGVSVNALQRLDVGWSGGEPMWSQRRGAMVPIYAWSFPIRDADYRVVGIRMRAKNKSADGSTAKFSFTGGSGGLFIPRGFFGLTRSRRLYLVEGPTDTAAAIDLGLDVIGRESATAGSDHVIAALRRRTCEEFVIFSQRDEAHFRPDGSPYWPAQDGAALAPRIRIYVVNVRIIMPPAGVGKDIRDWLRAGATRADVEALVDAAEPISLTIQSNESKLEGASK